MSEFDYLGYYPIDSTSASPSWESYRSDRTADELLPCPFCGGEAEYGLLGLVFCPDCGATIDVNNWNRRAERTCHKTGRPVRGLINVETAHCSECGAEIVTQTNEYTAKYCFCCGARLVAQ